MCESKLIYLSKNDKRKFHNEFFYFCSLWIPSSIINITYLNRKLCNALYCIFTFKSLTYRKIKKKKRISKRHLKFSLNKSLDYVFLHKIKKII